MSYSYNISYTTSAIRHQLSMASVTLLLVTRTSRRCSLRSLSLASDRSCDIPVTPTDLNNIHFNRFRNEFHYFSRFHGNLCPAGKYISLAHPSLLDKSSFLFPTPSNANTFRICQSAGILLHCSPFLLCSVTHTFSLSFSLSLSFSTSFRRYFSLALVPRYMRHKRLLSFCAVYVYTLE